MWSEGVGERPIAPGSFPARLRWLARIDEGPDGW
jgi:hypothetical protein